MLFLKLLFDNIKCESDNYNRKELIAIPQRFFGETPSRREIKKRARLWYAADHLTNAKLLNKLSHSPYIEVRESVAGNIHTSPETLKILLQDTDFEVREEAVFNPNSPLSKIQELIDDDNESVCKAVKQRFKT